MILSVRYSLRNGLLQKKGWHGVLRKVDPESPCERTLVGDETQEVDIESYIRALIRSRSKIKERKSQFEPGRW